MSTKTEFSKYKDIFKKLVHPAGMVNFNEYNALQQINNNIATVNTSSLVRTISGTVNVNSSIYVTGTNTKFNIASSRGILTVGNTISINSETRVVVAITSNTSLKVNSAFTYTSNGETLKIIS